MQNHSTRKSKHHIEASDYCPYKKIEWQEDDKEPLTKKEH